VSAVIVGALGSVGLTLYAGRTGPPILMPMFVVWVLSPFAALGVAEAVSKRWSTTTRTALHSVMLIVCVASLAIYTHRVMNPPKAQGAFVFVMVPPASWLFAAMTVPAAALMKKS